MQVIIARVAIGAITAVAGYVAYRFFQPPGADKSKLSPQTAQPSPSPKSEQVYQNPGYAARDFYNRAYQKPVSSAPRTVVVRATAPKTAQPSATSVMPKFVNNPTSPLKKREASEIISPVAQKQCACTSHTGKPKRGYPGESVMQEKDDMLVWDGFVMEQYPCPKQNDVFHLRTVLFTHDEAKERAQHIYYELGHILIVQKRKNRFCLELKEYDSKEDAKESAKNIEREAWIHMHPVKIGDGKRYRLRPSNPQPRLLNYC